MDEREGNRLWMNGKATDCTLFILTHIIESANDLEQKGKANHHIWLFD